MSKLHLAAAIDGLKLIQQAIRDKEDLNEHFPPYATPIFTAIMFGKLKAVKKLIRGGADVNAIDADQETPLFCAIHYGNLNVIKCLLDNGADINARALEYDSALHAAAKIHSPEIMELLIDRGLDVNTKNERDETALHIAAKSGKKHLVQLLLRKGADVNSVSRSLLDAGCKCCNERREGLNIGSNITALFLAVVKGFLDIADMLLKAGADPNIRTSDGMTPLHFVPFGHIKEEKLELVNLLLKAGADVNAKLLDGDATPLLNATKEGCTDIVSALLGVDGIDVNSFAKTGITPLILAAMDGNLEIVKLLIAKGAPMDEPVQMQIGMQLHFCTPLSAALVERKDNIAEFLIRSGADVNKKDPRGRTPFVFACNMHGFSPKIGELLLEKGVDVNEVFDGNTFLHIAASAKEDVVESVKFLVEHGVDTDAQNSLKFTPLHLAVSARHSKTVEYLVTKVKNIDPVNVFGQTPLMLAASLDLDGVMEMLINKGANPDVQDASEATALHIAAMGQKLESAKLLLKYKAAVNIKDCMEETPLFIATESGDEKFVNLLLNKDADPNAANKAGDLPIHLASDTGNIDIAKALLKKGAYYDVFGVTSDVQKLPSNLDDLFSLYKSPLECARKVGNVKIVTLLELIGELFDATVKNNAQEMKCCIEASRKLDFTEAVVNARNARGMTALYYAVNNENIEAVKTLLANGADIGLAENRGYTPLYDAVSKKNMEIVEILLMHAKTLTFTERNQVINAKMSGNRSLIIFATGDDPPYRVKLLLQGGPVHSNNGTSVLHLAAEKKSLDLVKLLIKNGAVYNIKNKCKQMPSELTTSEDIKSFFNSVEKLFQAVGNNHLEEVVRILEIDSSVVNARDMDGGGTPLYWAVSKGHTDIAKHLLTSDADCCLITNKGTTPLHIAASKGNVEMVKALVAKVSESAEKADSLIDAQTLRGTTALHAASSVDIVKYLLQSGATYNIRNQVDMTPLKSTQNTDIRKLLKTTHDLFREVKKGVPAVIDTLNGLELEEFKAVAKARNEEGKTLAVVAVASGHVKIASKLLEKLQKIG